MLLTDISHHIFLTLVTVLREIVSHVQLSQEMHLIPLYNFHSSLVNATSLALVNHPIHGTQ